MNIKTIKQRLFVFACVLAFTHAAFSQTSVNKGIHIIAAVSDTGPGQSVFPYTQGGASITFRTSKPIASSTTPIWSFGEPFTQQWNGSTDPMPVHVYRQVGRYFISCTLQDLGTGSVDTVIYDTVEIRGITPSIQSVLYNTYLLPEHKNQVYAKDTVDFVNTSIAFLPANIKLVWDFDDHFSAPCTSYSVPSQGASLPFTNAADLYRNSTHYYIYNGVTTAGKMNCRWSLDSLPRHKYTNWDSVYSWLVYGKTFPASWSLPVIAANTPLTITAQTPVPDPFWLEQGRIVNLTSGTFRNRFDSITINDPVLGVFKRYANAIVPNTNITFHELVFRYLYTTSTKVRLTAVNAANTPQAYDSVMMSLGKPLAYGLGIGGNIGRGRYNPGSVYGKYIEFSFCRTDKAAGTLPYAQSDVLFNFDSLADRQDITPCELDGFVDYTGGQTAGAIMQPGFNTNYDWSPFSFWQNGTYPKMIYHYGPQTALGANLFMPADSNGIITVGVIVANGVGSDKVWSDTVWYRQGVNVGQVYDASYTSDVNGCIYRPVGSVVTVHSDVQFLRDLVADFWYWGDGTYTIDSFWEAGAVITNSFYTNGKRRVRYQFDENGLKDSLVDPMGFAPRTPGRFYHASFIPVNSCGGAAVKSYTYDIDSAFRLAPVTHTYYKTSDGMANTIQRRLVTKQNGASAVTESFFIGKMALIGVAPSRRNDTAFCAGDEVAFIDSIKYYRRDCSFSDPMLNPNKNEYGQIMNPPYNSYHFDTANYWSRYSGVTADIKRTYFNPGKGRTDTVYYEKIYWDFNNDGITDATGTRPKYRFATKGLNRVKMITRDSTGYFDTAYTNVYVTEYTADFAWEKQDCDRSVMFTDISSPRDQSFWKFSSTHTYLNLDTSSVLYNYSSAGRYDVTMISVSKNGCLDTVQRTISIEGLLPRFAVLSDTIGCAPLNVMVALYADDTVSPAITTIFWGDSAGSYVVYPQGTDTLTTSFVYERPGTYFIRTIRGYTLTDSCTSTSAPRQIYVYARPIVNITGETNPVKGETYMYSSNISSALRHDWLAPSASIVSQDSSTIVLNWDTIGTYSLICIAGSNAANCVSSDTLMVNVGSTGLAESVGIGSIRIYPNPATHNITIRIDRKETWSKGELLIYDVLGKVKHRQYIESSGTTIQVGEWPKGVYFAALTLNNKQVIRKFFVE